MGEAFEKLFSSRMDAARALVSSLGQVQ